MPQYRKVFDTCTDSFLLFVYALHKMRNDIYVPGPVNINLLGDAVKRNFLIEKFHRYSHRHKQKKGVHRHKYILAERKKGKPGKGTTKKTTGKTTKVFRGGRKKLKRLRYLGGKKHPLTPSQGSSSPTPQKIRTFFRKMA